MVYVSDFRQLACDINWNKETLMNQFYWDLRANVKDLLLSLSNSQMLNEAISKVVKYDNHLFQRHQDQRSKQYMTRYISIMSTSSLNSHLKVEDMQIGTIHVKPFTTKEKKRHMEEG